MERKRTASEAGWSEDARRRGRLRGRSTRLRQGWGALGFGPNRCGGRLSGAEAAENRRVSLDRSSAARAMGTTKGSAHSNETAEANVVSPLSCRLEMSVSSTCYRHQRYEAWKSGSVRKNGGHARDYEGTVTEQLSSLASRLASDEAPNADFSVFSPFGKRTMKLMTFWAQIIVGGELTTKTVPVPLAIFVQWRTC